MVDIGIPPGVADIVGLLETANSWQGRLGEAAYTSPKATRIKFEYEDVRRVVTRRGTVFEFPDVDDAFVQQKGFGPRQYPLRCFFSGRDHDRIATAFEVALLEPGIGRLEHPRYGTIPRVVPFGTITRRDDLKTAANQSIVEVTFWTTLAEIFPGVQADRESEIVTSLGDFNVTKAQDYANNVDVSNAINQANVKATIRAFLRTVSASLRLVADKTSTVRKEFDEIFDIINLGLDVLVGQPLLLARQILNLIQAPARALAGIQSRLDAYANLAASIFGSDAGRPEDKAVSVSVSELTGRANDMVIADLFAMGAASGAVLSTVENEFATKPDAIGAADEVTEQFDDVVAWRDDALEVVGVLDTGEAYQALQESTALTAGFLVQISFELVAERQIVLDRARTIVDLSAELYGSVDDRLDLLIASNKLTGSEILEIPRGRLIKFYPA